MKKYLGCSITLLSILALALINGCMSAVPTAVVVTSHLASLALDKALVNKYDHRWLKEGKEIERHKIGDYEVRVSDGRADGSDYIFFSAYDYKKLDDPKLRVTARIELRKYVDDDMKIYDEYLKLETIDKKKFIKDSFNKIHNLDLGPIEETINK